MPEWIISPPSTTPPLSNIYGHPLYLLSDIFTFLCPTKPLCLLCTCPILVLQITPDSYPHPVQPSCCWTARRLQSNSNLHPSSTLKKGEGHTYTWTPYLLLLLIASVLLSLMYYWVFKSHKIPINRNCK